MSEKVDKLPYRAVRLADGSRRHRIVRRLSASIAVGLLICVVLASSGALAAAADFSSRPKVAVVLGGGAARGLSHIGLLRALEEHGIPVDMLVGTSMGSIVAGLYAAGLSVDNLTYLATRIDMNRLFESRFPPRGGLVDTEPFEVFLDVVTRGARLERMSIPFYSIVADLQTGETMALNHGPVGRAIVASMAIPGVFRPVEIDGWLYVDGGLVSSVAVKAARQAGADFVIAVDVRRAPEEIEPGTLLANLQLALSVLLDQRTDAELLAADVLVTPNVSDSSYMEFDRAEEFIAEGYRAAVAAMDEIKAGLRRLDPSLPLEEPRIQTGIPMDEFPRIAGDAVTLALAQARLTPQLLPAAVFSSEAPPRTRLEVHVPLRTSRWSLPWFVDYSLTNDGDTSYHAVGLGFGYCGRLCAGVFGRLQADQERWNPGIMVSGTLGVGWSPNVASAQWRAFWEWMPGDVRDEWLLQVRAPAPDALTVAGGELLVAMGRDARGIYGRPDGDGRGAAVWRRYWLGEPANVLELVRGAVHWYVGGGLGVSRESGKTRLYPIVEAGALFEGRLFGLYAARSRLALTYEADDNAWFVRFSVGD